MAPSERRRGITIYRATDAVDLAETDFMVRPVTSPGVPSTSNETVGADAAEGFQIKVLVRDGGGFSLLHVWFKANYPLPRHSHNTDCMYYVISGSAVMGNQTLHAGDSFFVPRDALYQYTAGPGGVEVLEVRHGAKQFDVKVADASARWQVLADAIAANRDRWAEDPISPTFTANAT
jgi:mannose-6-phosphate isomerase-like protein (cupin superfamily)